MDKEFDYTKEFSRYGEDKGTCVIQHRKKAGHPPNPVFEPHTHDGHIINYKQTKFLDNLIELGDIAQAAKVSGYTTGSAKKLLTHNWVKDEIQYRMSLIESMKIASAEEILEYLTRVMRGEEKDQFGLDVPISERTRAAQELARRIIDIPNKEEEEAKDTQVKLIIQRKPREEVIDGEFKEIKEEEAVAEA